MNGRLGAIRTNQEAAVTMQALRSGVTPVTLMCREGEAHQGGISEEIQGIGAQSGQRRLSRKLSPY